VFAFSAVGAVVIRVVHVGEGGSLELGVLHVTTVTSIACGHPRDNSYSGCGLSLLDEDVELGP